MRIKRIEVEPFHQVEEKENHLCVHDHARCHCRGQEHLAFKQTIYSIGCMLFVAEIIALLRNILYMIVKK